MSKSHWARNSKYAVGVILFHPDERIIARMELIIGLNLPLYVFDNSSCEQVINLINRGKGNDGLFYITAGKNVGVARSLSILCATAFAHGHRRMLFLDQDTGVSERTFKYIDEFISSTPIQHQQDYAAIVFSGKKSRGQAIADVTFAINSGSLYALHILRRLGWHNDQYFVDCVDYEFCIRAIQNGFHIGVVYNTPDFDHISEQPDRFITILGKELSVRRYSIARIKDAYTAYMRLLGYTARLLRPDLFLGVFRSLLIYTNGQVIARLPKHYGRSCGRQGNSR